MKNHLLCLLSFLKNNDSYMKNCQSAGFWFVLCVRTLRFSDFQGCQIFTQASVLINTLLINDLIVNPSLSSEKSPETLQNGACVFLVALLDVLLRMSARRFGNHGYSPPVQRQVKVSPQLGGV